MRLLTTVFILVSLTMVSSRGYSMRQPNDLTVNETLPNDVHMAAAVHDHNLTESVIPKKKTVMETATTIATAILDIRRAIKVSDSRIITGINDLTLVLLEALKAAALEFIKTFARKATFLFAELPINGLTSLMESPLFNSAMNILLPLLMDNCSQNDYLDVDDTRRQLTNARLFSKK